MPFATRSWSQNEASTLAVTSIDEKLGALAAQIAAHHRIRGCDAVYVALAQNMGIPLITLDRQQRERVPSSVTALTPAEALAALL